MLSCDLIKRSIPNFLSISRILFTLAFIFFIQHDSPAVALLFFVIAAVTDLLDGYLARLWNVVSRLGSILDPIADKCLMISSYTILGLTKFIPLYVTLAVVIRDVFILVTVGVCRFYDIRLKFKPLYSSKVNTVIQLTYVMLILACRYFSLDVPLITVSGAVVVTASTIFSAAEYARDYYWIKDAICKYKNRR